MKNPADTTHPARQPLTVLIGFLLLALTSGCNSMRAQAGVGFGFGVDVKIPYALHLPLVGGMYKYAGPNYGATGETEGWWDADAGFLVHFSHRREQMFGEDVPYTDEHACFGLLPQLGQGEEKKQVLEIGVHLLFISFKLGWDPKG